MSTVSWLHISDLHFGDNSEFSRRSRDSLKDFIKKGSFRNVDYLFLTGDLVYAKGKDETEKKEAFTEAQCYLKKIFENIWGIPYTPKDFSSRVFMVPGNHDIWRSKALAAVRSTMIKDYHSNTQDKIDDSYLQSAKDALRLYEEFYDALYGTSADCHLHSVKKTNKLNILHINTTISSGRDNEEGELIVGYDLLSKEIDKIDTKKPTIALAHHSIAFLDWQEQKRIEQLLKQKQVFLYLCGHSHERESSILLKADQKRILNIFTSGALMADNGKGYIDTVFLYGQMDLEKEEGEVASWKWDSSNGWHEDNEFGLVQGVEPVNIRTFRNGNVDMPYSPINTQGITGQGVMSKIVGHTEADRQRAFIDINEKACSSLSVYGVGITHVSKDKDLLKRILNANGQVRLCMVDPRIFTSGQTELTDSSCELKKCNLNDLNFCIYSAHMDKYIREEYVSDVINSYRRILKFKKDNNNKNLKIRVLQSFVPISVNIVNEKDNANAELIVEYNMPFVEKRLLIRLSKRENENYYYTILNAYEKLWDNAKDVEEN